MFIIKEKITLNITGLNTFLVDTIHEPFSFIIGLQNLIQSKFKLILFTKVKLRNLILFVSFTHVYKCRVGLCGVKTLNLPCYLGFDSNKLQVTQVQKKIVHSILCMQ